MALETSSRISVLSLETNSYLAFILANLTSLILADLLLFKLGGKKIIILMIFLVEIKILFL
jgi:hypothetical protein